MERASRLYDEGDVTAAEKMLQRAAGSVDAVHGTLERYPALSAMSRELEASMIEAHDATAKVAGGFARTLAEESVRLEALVLSLEARAEAAHLPAFLECAGKAISLATEASSGFSSSYQLIRAHHFLMLATSEMDRDPAWRDIASTLRGEPMHRVLGNAGRTSQDKSLEVNELERILETLGGHARDAALAATNGARTQIDFDSGADEWRLTPDHVLAGMERTTAQKESRVATRETERDAQHAWRQDGARRLVEQLPALAQHPEVLKLQARFKAAESRGGSYLYAQALGDGRCYAPTNPLQALYSRVVERPVFHPVMTSSGVRVNVGGGVRKLKKEKYAYGSSPEQVLWCVRLYNRALDQLGGDFRPHQLIGVTETYSPFRTPTLRRCTRFGDLTAGNAQAIRDEALTHRSGPLLDELRRLDEEGVNVQPEARPILEDVIRLLEEQPAPAKRPPPREDTYGLWWG